MICGICNRPWADERCHTITLTEQEQAIVFQTTGQKVETYTYCGPCWKLLQDPRQGAQFIAGSMRAAARAAGNPNADKVGKRTFDFLLSRVKKPVSLTVMDGLENLVNRLHQIHKEHGEEAWLAAIRQAAKDSIRAGGQMATFGKKTFGDIHPSIVWAELEAEVAAEDQADKAAEHARLFMKALQDQLPALKSQGQFTAFQASFEAFRAVVNGILTQNTAAEAAGKEALSKALETLRMATHLTRKLEEVPEAATSPAAEDFKKPPTAFTEYDKQRALLSELAKINDLPSLGIWWTENRKRIDEVQTPSLRNPLIDAVRDKQETLKGPQA